MSTINKFRRTLDPDAVHRARQNTQVRDAHLLGRDRRRSRRTLARLGYGGHLLQSEVDRLCAMRPQYREQALRHIQKRAGLRSAA